jgi:hypothetical protein
MTITIRLVDMSESTPFAPLGVLGYCLNRTDFLKIALDEIDFSEKEVKHAPAAKLSDTLVSILAGCRSISTINTRIRPDLALAAAWGRPQFAEQSTIARTLDSFSEEQVAQLRAGTDRLFQRESRTWRHDFAQSRLWLDLDLSPMPTSKRAQGSRKGKMGDKKTVTGASWRV